MLLNKMYSPQPTVGEFRCKLVCECQRVRKTGIVWWLKGGESILVCEQHRSTLCVWMGSQVCGSLPFSLPAALSGEKTAAETSCASRRKHIGQLRQRLCIAPLRVWLIESERQPLTALGLRTLLVITHKSLFPCIGSSAQLRPHKQST